MIELKLSLDSPRFNIVHILNIKGPLDAGGLERHLLQIRRRHFNLQSVFDAGGNRLEGVEQSEKADSLSFLDLTDLHTTAQKFSFSSILQELYTTKLNPHSGHLLQTYLVRWKNEDHSILFLGHALVVDARSLEILSGELVEMFPNDYGADAHETSSETLSSIESGSWARGQRIDPSSVFSLPGRTEIKASIPVESITRSGFQIAEKNTRLVEIATAAFVAHNEQNPLPQPVFVQAVVNLKDAKNSSPLADPLDQGDRPELADIAGSKFQEILTLTLNELSTPLSERLDTQETMRFEDPLSRNGSEHTSLRVRVQEVIPSFTRSVGPLQFVVGEIRNPVCDADISLFLSKRESEVCVLLNYDSQLLEANEMRRWLESYLSFLGRVGSDPTWGISDSGPGSSAQFSLIGKTQDKVNVPSNNNSATRRANSPAPALLEQLVSTKTETERKLARIWSDLLKINDINLDESFFDLGGHSLLAVRLFSQITSEFGTELSLNALLEGPTIRQLAALIETPPSLEAECRLVSLQSKGIGSKVPIFWIPGGRAISVLAFREASALLGVDQPVYGLESRLPRPGGAVLTVSERAAKYIQLLRSVQPRGPYCLAGFCMGGMVAFEMAQQLKAEGEDTALLTLVQAAMPGFPASRLQRLHMRYQHRWSLCKTLLKFLYVHSAPNFLRIPISVKQQVLDEVSKLIFGWHGTSAKLPDETQTFNSQIMYAYKPRPYEGNVHLILAEDCYESSGISSSLDPRRAWSGVVTGKCVTHVVGGDHNSMLANGNASGLAQCMRTLLDEATKETHAP